MTLPEAITRIQALLPKITAGEWPVTTFITSQELEDNAEFIALTRNHIAAILERLQELEAAEKVRGRELDTDLRVTPDFPRYETDRGQRPEGWICPTCKDPKCR